MYEKIAKWILNGRLPTNLSEVESLAYSRFMYISASKTSTEFVSLLPILVDRGYGCELKRHRAHELWNIEIIRDDLMTIERNFIISANGNTISEAIGVAMLGVIDKETES